MGEWKIKYFAEIATVGSGQVDPKQKPFCDFVHIGPENVESNTGRILNPELAKKLALISGKYEFDENSIVYSKIRPNLNKLCIPKFSGICSADMYPIWTKACMTKEYLYYFMQSPIFVNAAIKCSMRTGLPKINRQDLNKIKIHFPIDIQEQKAIADTLQKWDTAIEKTQALIAAKEQEYRAYIKKFISFSPNSQGCKNITLAEIGEISSAGVDKKIIEGEEDVVLLNYLDVYRYDKIFSKNITHKVTAPKYKVKNCSVKKGDIFFTPSSEILGDIGHSAVAMEDIEKGVYSYHVIRLRPKININTLYCAYAFKSDNFYKQVSKYADGSGQRYVVSQNSFRKISISLPPIAEQKTIAETLSTAQKEIDLLKKLVEKYQLQKRGLMQKLLTGEWRLEV